MKARAIATVVLTASLMAAPASGAPAKPAKDRAARSARADRVTLTEPPIYGVYYDRYEPTFYTGFAPRARDAKQVHLHLGRGNQLRVTMVLTDDVLDAYARDLDHRQRTYRALVDEGRIVLTQNDAFAEFERTLTAHGLDRLVAEESDLSRDERRRRNLDLLEKLNPGRVFRIRMPIADLVRRWASSVRPGDRDGMSRDRQLELLNALLPTRTWAAEVGEGTARRLREAVAEVPADGSLDPAALARLEPRFLALLDEVGHGLYPRRGDALEWAELTAIYPVGTLNASTPYKGREIPLYPTPGRRALTTHQRTKTVDHIPDVIVYSYSPWIPYMHVGPRMHNAFHTLYWRMETATAPFLTEPWRRGERARRADGEPYRYLWLLSRGPMSHGCTHVNAGHIAELRQILPAETEQLYEVDAYLNRSYDYDVFDVDGDGTAEVMGVHYFIAFTLRDERHPYRLRVANERRAYYDWLYGGDLRYEADGRGYFEGIHDGRFVERTAREGRPYERIALYEAAYEQERVQFYELVDIPFARELRQVAIDVPYPKLARLAAR